MLGATMEKERGGIIGKGGVVVEEAGGGAL